MHYSTEIIKEKDGSSSLIVFYPHFFETQKTQDIFLNLESMNDFKSGFCFGREIKRQQKWFSLNKKSLNDKWKQDFDRWQYFNYEDWLLELQKIIFEKINFDLKDLFEILGFQQINFNNVLINKYRNGDDFIRPHRDSEFLFGDNPTIVSLSIGGSRNFVMKRVHYDEKNIKSLKENKQESHLNRKYVLKNGSLIIMAGSTQKFYSHEIQKSLCDDVRYNLTFRNFI
jgi:alkylated DNA repair dioxygenase AlkB